MEMFVFYISVVDVNIFLFGKTGHSYSCQKIDRIVMNLSVLNVRKKLVRLYWSGQPLVLQLLGQI